MPKHIIKRFTPDHSQIREHRHLKVFGDFLRDPNLWHMNRRSVSGAFAIGLFWAFIPIPFQMIAAAATAIPARVNMPISVALVWITNPLTMPPMFYFNYTVGTWLMGSSGNDVELELTLASMKESLAAIWQQLYLGSLICALVAAVVGFLGIRLIWRMHIVQYMRRRRQLRKAGGQ